jgi:hypothetical protein
MTRISRGPHIFSNQQPFHEACVCQVLHESWVISDCLWPATQTSTEPPERARSQAKASRGDGDHRSIRFPSAVATGAQHDVTTASDCWRLRSREPVWLPRTFHPCRCSWHRTPETACMKPGSGSPFSGSVPRGNPGLLRRPAPAWSPARTRAPDECFDRLRPRGRS